MPVRATKRGAERTPIGGDHDVLICGASFAGLTIARELRATGARVLVLDRYEIGERQTSACAAPTEWLRNLGLESSIRQTFGSLLVHTPGATRPLAARLDVLHVRLPRAVRPAVGAARRRDGVRDREGRRPDGRRVHTDRGDVTAPLVIDALGWKRNLGAQLVQPPNARLSRGLEVHPGGTGDDLELWIDKRVIRAGYGWSFPARDELRVGIGSFDPHDHVKEPTVRLAGRPRAAARRLPGQLDPAPAAPGDRGRRLLRRRLRRPLPAADRRGHPHRVLLRHRRRARAARGARGPARPRRGAAPLPRVLRRAPLEVRVHAADPARDPEAAPAALTAWRARSPAAAPAHWAFRHYLRIAPPEFALPAPPAARGAGGAGALRAAWRP